MRSVSLVLAALMVASPVIAQKKAMPRPLSDAERRQLAGVVGTLDLVEARLQRDIALGRPDAEANLQKAVNSLGAYKDIASRGPGPCPPGTCQEDNVCMPCFPPFCNLITLNGDFRGIKNKIMSSRSGEEPPFRRFSKRVITLAQQLVKDVSGKEPLTASGYCPSMDIVMPCK